MKFEKWQALGNDYVIVELAEVPFELTPARIRAICASHLGVGSDGILLLLPPDAPGFVARLRIFNSDGSEPELSGNGAREAILYLRRRGWTDADAFSIQTLAGEIRPRITGPSTCTVDMGRAALSSKDYPGGFCLPASAAPITRAFPYKFVQTPKLIVVLHESDTPGLRLDPPDPQTNILFAKVDPGRGTARDLQAALKERGVLVNATAPTRVRLVTHLDISSAQAEQAAEVFRRVVQRLTPAA